MSLEYQIMFCSFYSKDGEQTDTGAKYGAICQHQSSQAFYMLPFCSAPDFTDFLYVTIL
jgi:hypothetical protein